MIQSDFARLEVETTSAEKQGSKEFESFMEDSKLDVASKEKDVEHKGQRKESEAQKLRALQTDLSAVQKDVTCVWMLEHHEDAMVIFTMQRYIYRYMRI